jgi:peptidoglycan/LPS O-acetylase OafA/YrhL
MRRQRGYLMEVPLLLMVVGVVAAILVPNLEPVGQKIVVGLAAVAALFGLYYMIVVPGWTPGGGGLRRPWNWLAFALAALAIGAGAALFILS